MMLIDQRRSAVIIQAGMEQKRNPPEALRFLTDARPDLCGNCASTDFVFGEWDLSHASLVDGGSSYEWYTFVQCKGCGSVWRGTLQEDDETFHWAPPARPPSGRE